MKETIAIKLRKDDELEVEEGKDGTTTVLLSFEAAELNSPKFHEGISHAVEQLGLSVHETAKMEDEVYLFIMRKVRLIALEDRLA